MKSLFKYTIILLLASSTLFSHAVIIPSPPHIAASSYILMDANSGAIIVEHNADTPLPPASLTKLMTSYILAYELAQGRVSNDDEVTISRNAWAQNPLFTDSSLMWIEVGKQVPLIDLHRGVVVSSGNDASVAVAEYLAGSESAFADVMNQHAQRLGMHNSHFVNAHGLPDPDHYTTARDLALLMQALLLYPESYDLYSEVEYTYNNIRTVNRSHRLLTGDIVDGLKTGHTEEAGYCLVASDERDGMRLISVVMGTDSPFAREQATQQLLSYGFRYFETVLFAGAEQTLAEMRVWGGSADEVALGVEQDEYITIPRGTAEQLTTTVLVGDFIRAPVEVGQVYGDLLVTLDDEEIASYPLVALQPVDRGGLFKRGWDGTVLFFKNLF